MNKEQIYDEEIWHLMDQIIKICQKNKIAMLASFALPTEESPDLMCTTALLGDDFEPPAKLRQALTILKTPVASAAFTIQDMRGASPKGIK